mgnify:CR=1 FL=1
MVEVAGVACAIGWIRNNKGYLVEVCGWDWVEVGRGSYTFVFFFKGGGHHQAHHKGYGGRGQMCIGDGHSVGGVSGGGGGGLVGGQRTA